MPSQVRSSACSTSLSRGSRVVLPRVRPLGLRGNSNAIGGATVSVLATAIEERIQ